MKFRVFLIIFLLYLSNTIHSKEYTIQIGVSSDSAQAEIVRIKILEATTEPVYITRDSSVYKIQVGYFTSPESAKSVQASLQEKGYTGFIVPTTLKKSVSTISTTTPAKQVSKPKKTSKVSSPLREIGRVKGPAPTRATLDKIKKYTIQVGVCPDSMQAEIVRAKILEATAESVYITRDSSFYKIQVGIFSSKESAKLIVPGLREKGYTGFIIPVSEYQSIGGYGEITSVPPMKQPGGYGIQLHACLDTNKAIYLLKKYEEKYRTPAYIISIPPYHKVIAGNFNTRDEAKKLITTLRTDYPDAFIIISQVFSAKGGSSASGGKETEAKPEETSVEPLPLRSKSQDREITQRKTNLSKSVSNFYVEIDVFREKMMADQIQRKLQREFVNKQLIIRYDRPYYKVMFVDFKDVDEAMEMVSILQKSGYERALLIFE